MRFMILALLGTSLLCGCGAQRPATSTSLSFSPSFPSLHISSSGCSETGCKVSFAAPTSCPDIETKVVSITEDMVNLAPDIACAMKVVGGVSVEDGRCLSVGEYEGCTPSIFPSGDTFLLCDNAEVCK